MGWGDEYIIKIHMTDEGAQAMGVKEGYLVRQYDRPFELTGNFTKATRFRDEAAAERCVETIKSGDKEFAAYIASVEYISVRE